MPRHSANAQADRWMGRVEERLDNLCDEVRTEREGASEHRQALRKVIEALSLSVQALTAEVSAMKPEVRDYQKRRDEAMGAAKMARILWGIVATIAGGLGAGVFELGRYFAGR